MKNLLHCSYKKISYTLKCYLRNLICSLEKEEFTLPIHYQSHNLQFRILREMDTNKNNSLGNCRFIKFGECHLSSYTTFTGLKLLQELSSYEKEILELRSEIKVTDNDTICLHHEQVLLLRYSFLQKKCCDPLSLHKKTSCKRSLREISVAMSQKLAAINVAAKPGQKLCPKCRIALNEKMSNKETIENTDCLDDAYDFVPEIRIKDVRTSLNASLDEMGVSPVKLHSLPSHSKVSYGKRKIQQVHRKLEEKVGTIQSEVAEVMSIASYDLSTNVNVPDNFTELKEKAHDLDRLLFLMKEKIKNCTREKKIQILTMMPGSWSVKKAKEFFNVSAYIVRQARKLAAENGILELPGNRQGTPFSQEIKTLVTNLYCDDEFSRAMPGSKDFVSIRRNVHVQKRLLLCTLKELFCEFKKQFPDKKIGFSKFCALRPKQCILAGSPGTHSVCVCSIHENVKLMLSAVKLQKSYHELIDMIVCSRESKQCMVHRCPSCPDGSALTSYLKQHLEQHACKNLRDDDHDDSDDEDYENGDEQLEEMEEDTISFCQWTSVDRSQLVSMELPISEFIFTLAHKLGDLTSHSFIAKAQAQYLKQCKNELKAGDFVILLDFAENYNYK